MTFTCFQALSHEWIEQHRPPAEELSSSSIAEGLEDYAASPHFVKASAQACRPPRQILHFERRLSQKVLCFFRSRRRAVRIPEA